MLGYLLITELLYCLHYFSFERSAALTGPLGFSIIQGLDGLCQEGNSTSWMDLDYDYKTKAIHNEVIVKFRGFYQAETRRNYIEAALNHDSKVNIIERTNVMAQYPSDFDVVNFQEDLQGEKSEMKHSIFKASSFGQGNL